MHLIMKNNFLHAVSKNVVKKHADDKDTRTIWQLVCKHYDESAKTKIDATSKKAIFGCWTSLTSYQNLDVMTASLFGQLPIITRKGYHKCS